MNQILTDPELDAALAELAGVAAQALSTNDPALIDPALPERMGRTEDLTELFAMARTISPFLDADMACRVLASLEAADAEHKAVGWLALWGRTEPAVLDRMAAAFVDERESAAARATAARVLGDGLSHLEAATREAVLAASRGLLVPGVSPELAGEAAGLLASAGTPEDVQRILAAAEAGADPRLRMRAVEVLIAAGAPVADLSPVLRRMAADANLPAEYRDVAQGALGLLDLGLLERQP